MHVASAGPHKVNYSQSWLSLSRHHLPGCHLCPAPVSPQEVQALVLLELLLQSHPLVLLLLLVLVLLVLLLLLLLSSSSSSAAVAAAAAAAAASGASAMAAGSPASSSLLLLAFLGLGPNAGNLACSSAMRSAIC